MEVTDWLFSGFCLLSGAIVVVGLLFAAYLDLKSLKVRANHGPQAMLEPASDPRRGFEVKPITGIPPVAEKEADDHG